ncbi:tannase/feruloyl esterase family alpha/beta hydrolase [Sphingomonas sanguinis]|uniref:tannase/feruloyl esterase family alpha/beta hydrolase n=1 Tax=Sphingomonas sp. LC-1 TaxID=3110957 RepID=UPI0021BB9BFB|nr:tannase/feruloyl esterase family alpha/beta hydrolase [Sphingomonas sp. LC-1]MCT8003952.1 tannase/feruloyl esterase family alpha/beta hydrolase [Sphingomonas sp. LC-1]
MRRQLAVATMLAGSMLAGCATPAPPNTTTIGAASPQGCAALAMGGWADPTLRILTTDAHPAGVTLDAGFGAKTAPLPAHCEVSGILHERTGQDGQKYAIRFRMRLPDQWNKRFLFQGGGGTNGDIGNAVGPVGPGATALAQGYAVISQDSGHSNTTNADPARGGTVSFGFDAQARADYGHAALKASYDTARAILTRYYHSDPAHSYFAGCSKGGQEGMAFAQRYPDAFDGILAAAPGFALPKAAIAEAWDTQTYAALVRAPGETSVPVARLAQAFSTSDLLLARAAVLAACDAKDGLADGLVGAFAQCTTPEVVRELRARQCTAGKNQSCLAPGQIDALVQGFGGPRDSRGTALYASFPWDAGLSDDGWRVWKLGLAQPAVPAINAAMGAPALATIFSTPPRALAAGPQAGMDYQLAYDFDRDPAAIQTTAPGFPRSAWNDIAARSSDLTEFRAHGGRMIVPHGVSDPVFSINDTIAWFNDVNRHSAGQAASFVRVFPVPGMAHCQGGPATDQFDAFTALVRWVEQGTAPDRIEATAGPATPWPGRTRPLCPYPLVARPVAGTSDTEKSLAFNCT